MDSGVQSLVLIEIITARLKKLFQKASCLYKIKVAVSSNLHHFSWTQKHPFCGPKIFISCLSLYWKTTCLSSGVQKRKQERERLKVTPNCHPSLAPSYGGHNSVPQPLCILGWSLANTPEKELRPGGVCGIW